MHKVLFAALFFSPLLVHAQDIKCPKGYQPYADRCVSQLMADYISCVEASGGNRDVMLEEVTELGGQKASTNIKGSGSGTIVKGAMGLSLNKASERALAKKWETRWFQGGMSECSKVLDKPTVRDIKKTIKEAVKESTVQTSGVILPDNKSTPRDLQCLEDVSVDDLVLIYGNSVSYTNKFPHTVIKIGNNPLLIVGKKGRGITVTGKFFSLDNKIVAELKDNKFYVNPNNYFRIERPSKHILIVYDQQGNQALNVEYLNPSTIKILGRFNFPNGTLIVLSEEGTRIGQSLISRACGGRVGGADIYIRE